MTASVIVDNKLTNTIMIKCIYLICKYLLELLHITLITAFPIIGAYITSMHLSGTFIALK